MWLSENVQKKLRIRLTPSSLSAEIANTHGLVKQNNTDKNENKNTTNCRRRACCCSYIIPSAVHGLFTKRSWVCKNTVLNSGYTLVCNPLNGTTNGASGILTGLTSGETVLTWTGHGYFAYTYQGAGVGTGLGFQSDWTDGGAVPPAPPVIPGDQTDTSDGLYWAPQPILTPGKGFFVQNPNPKEKNTFTVTVITTNIQTLTPGYSLVASAIPVGGNVQTNAAITLTQNFAGGETVLVWTGSGYYAYTYQGAGVGTVSRLSKRLD